MVKCQRCEKSFQTEKGLKQHMTKAHTTEEMIGCSLCENTFDSISDLNSHTEKIHGVSGSPESKKLRFNSKSVEDMEIQVCEKEFGLENVANDALEEMEIDVEDETTKLSRWRDEKIIEKRNLIEKQEEIDKKTSLVPKSNINKLSPSSSSSWAVLVLSHCKN